MDYFAWGFIKTKLYHQKINSLTWLKEPIQLAVQEIIQNVFSNAKDRFEICGDTDGAHVRNVQ